MKTLLFTLEYPPFKGGVANYYGQLVKSWPQPENIFVLDNERQALDSGQGGFSWRRAFGALRRQIKQQKIDYVLVGQILPLGTVAWLASWQQSFKYAVFLHGMDLAYALKSRRKAWLAEHILQRADKIICANSYTATQAQAAWPRLAVKIAVVNPGVPISPTFNAQEIAAWRVGHQLAGKTALFTLGRLVRRKGVDQTIKALAGISEPLSNNLYYFIAGGGPDEAYLRSLVPSRLVDKIIFLGEISESEKWQWLAGTDIFIMPARNIIGDLEGFGIVYLEAALSGRPVIAGAAGGVRDAVLDELTGLVVKPEDETSIREAIVRLAADPAERQRLGEAGRQRAQTEFNQENQVRKIFDLLVQRPAAE